MKRVTSVLQYQNDNNQKLSRKGEGEGNHDEIITLKKYNRRAYWTIGKRINMIIDHITARSSSTFVVSKHLKINKKYVHVNNVNTLARESKEFARKILEEIYSKQ